MVKMPSVNIKTMRSFIEQAFPLRLVPDKKRIRHEMRSKRQLLDPRARRYKNRLIYEHLIDTPELHNAETIAVYASLAEEVDADSIIDYLLGEGNVVVLPRVVDGSLRFHQVCDLSTELIQDNHYGILEPNPERCPEVSLDSIDLFLVPGIVFDPFGGRIGFGGGYYDKVLSDKADSAISIGLAYDFQVIPTLPIEEHDQCVSQIITETCCYNPQISHYHCPTENDTMNVARHLWKNYFEEKENTSDSPSETSKILLALHGDLGIGKTVFVKGIASALGAENQVASPTFVFCREYHGDETLYHIDAYRLESVSENDRDFWDDILQHDGIICIEWAERLADVLPRETIHLFGTMRDNGDRDWTLLTSLENQRYLHQRNNEAKNHE